MKMYRIIFFSVFLSAGAALAASPTVPSPSAASSQPASTAPEYDLPAIIQGLASADFATREAAQRQLETIPWQRRAMLVSLADAQSDAEVKSRILARILQIDEQLAVDPPPISLHVKNASPMEVAAAMSKELGLNVTFSPAPDALQGFVSLDMDGSFWDVCGALAQKNIGRMVVSRAAADNRTLLSIGPLRSYNRTLGFAAVPLLLQYTQRFDAQAAPGADPMLTRLAFQMTIVADPRIKVVGITPPHLTSAVDEKGNSFLKAVAPLGTMVDAVGRTSGLTTAFDLQIPAQHGNKIASIKGEARFEVQVSEIRNEIADVQKHVGDQVNIGTQTLTIALMEFRNANLQMTLQIRQNDPNTQIHPLEMALQDQNGLPIWNGTVSGSIGTTIGGQPQGPFKLIITAPDHTKTVTVPFEFKDLPLPG